MKGSCLMTLRRKKEFLFNDIFELLFEPFPKINMTYDEAAKTAALQSGFATNFDIVGAESAFDYIIAMLVMVHVTNEREDLHRDHFRRKVYHLCKLHRNDAGRYWKILAEMLYINQRTPASMWRVIYDNFSPDDIRGNIIRRVRHIISHNAIQWITQTAPSTAPVKKPQRIRGYRDKGHLPDPSKGQLRIGIDSRELSSISKEENFPKFQEFNKRYYLYDPLKYKRLEAVLLGLDSELCKVRRELAHVREQEENIRRTIRTIKRKSRKYSKKERKSFNSGEES